MRDVLELLREQRKAGQIAELDVAAQEAALAQVELTLPPLQKALAQQRDLLVALAGGLPSDKLMATFELAAMRLPRDLPVSLPSRLIEQRPDIKAAEANLHAAGALVGVAIANRLPNIVLTGVAGSTAPQLSQLFASGTEWWEITGAVTQPIFRGGTLFHRELAAKAAFDQAKAQYRGTVIQAFQNVGDALQAIRSDAIALQKAVEAERAAGKSLEIVRGRLRLGDINYLGLLTAQQTYQQALLSLAQAKAQRYADTVALFAALGGGWWNRQDVAPEKPLTIGDFFQ
jgi:NodT family efflux transporter outer membrane factor (OMF) lipoprotein